MEIFFTVAPMMGVGRRAGKRKRTEHKERQHGERGKRPMTGAGPEQSQGRAPRLRARRHDGVFLSTYPRLLP
jgi:hypothetical protein